MRRGEAGMAAKRCTYLTAAEKHVFQSLLERSDNTNCAVPHFTTPSMADLALWTSLHRATVYRAVEHLERHGWLSHEAGGGRGRRSKYSLVPRVPDTVCGCERVARRDPLGVGKGRRERHKGSQEATQRVALLPSSPQVDTAFVHREAGKKGSSSPALHRCDRCRTTPARTDNSGARYCEGCAPHLWKVTA